MYVAEAQGHRRMSTDVLQQAILWRRIDSPGHDACGLWVGDDGWRLAGTAAFSLEGTPYHLRYEVYCDRSWHTLGASVTGWCGRTAVKLVLESVPGKGWILNGKEQGEEVTGLVDVDLGFTPATNLIQLRRLSLGVGHEAEAPVAYLHFPKLRLGRLAHRYRRMAFNEYYYEAPIFSYAAILNVSDQGFVTEYPGLWTLESLR
jgi:hypothetical protein